MYYNNIKIINMNEFKKPLTLDEQIVYIGINKRIVFNVFSKEKAKEFLLRYNYINTITPFKYNFFRKHNNQPVFNNNHCHIYDKDTDFAEYVKLYKSERENYKILFEHISCFETQFNAIVSYNVLNDYNIDSTESFDNFVNDLINNAKNKLKDSNSINYVLDCLNQFSAKLNKYGSPFIAFDRFTLNEICQIYKFVNPKTKSNIFSTLIKYNLAFDYNQENQFDDFLNRLVKIRNYVYHNSSLTILFKYYNVSTKNLRTSSDERRYRTAYRKILNFKNTE